MIQKSRYEPLYVQIADQLRDEIGGLESGVRIPSEPQLARDWGVSRFTVTRAVAQLVDEGLVTRRQGSGSFVAEAPLRRAPGYLLSFTEAVEAAGHVATHRLLSYHPVAWQTGLPYAEGMPLLLLDRLRLVDGRAVARHRSILSAELASRIGMTQAVAAMPRFSLYRFFAQRGLSIASATERLVACTAEPDDRELLDLTGEGVVVAVTRHSFSADGMPLDAVNAVYDARRYSYEAQLVRQYKTGNRKNRETQNAHAHYEASRHNGPRLGPWDDTSGSG